MPRADERRGGHRSPPAAAARVEKSSEQPERRNPAGGRARRERDPRRLPENVETHQQQIGVDDAARGADLDIGQKPGAQDRAQHAGHAEARHHPPIHVAVIEMRRRRSAGGENLGGVDQRARLRRRQAHGQQRGVRQHAVRHAEGAVHQLCNEADGEQQHEFGGHRMSFPAIFRNAAINEARAPHARCCGHTLPCRVGPPIGDALCALCRELESQAGWVIIA